MPVPVIDLFAGPGGLGEGFASLRGRQGDQPFFRLALSIERDAMAHRTLVLRAVFRLLRESRELHHYYRFIRGEIDGHAFRRIPTVAQAFDQAAAEAKCLELGRVEESAVDRQIHMALGGAETWVLIGGPPCQAYSIAGALQARQRQGPSQG
jgi:DNA (cytosine-5)-methyltransferase 1